MAIPLVVNGVTFQYPQQFDKNWGPTLTNWSSAVTSGMLQKAGGSFTLTSEVNFGASFGLKVLSIKSQETNIASTGYLRLGNASPGVVWRNAANSADLALTVNASNQLTFNGIGIGATTSLSNTHILVGNASNQPADVAMSGDITITNTGVTAIGAGKVLDANVGSAAAIALSKLAASTGFSWYVANTSGVLTPQTVTASRAVATDSSGLPVASAATATELGYLSGVGSALQTQINGLLPKSGGTMTGILNMGGSRIAAIGTPTTSGDAAQYPITTAQLATNAISQLVNSASGTASYTGTQATSKTITTTGGTILVMGTLSGFINSTGGSSPTDVINASLNRGGVALVGGQAQQGISYTGASGGRTAYFGVPLIGMETPSAGTYTYTLDYNPNTNVTISSYQLVVLELKK